MDCMWTLCLSSTVGCPGLSAGLAAQGARQEPHTRICPAEEIDLVAGEIDASQTQIGDRLHRIERKLGAQVSSVSSSSTTIPTPARDMTPASF
jgi:hypothetical protein